MAETREMAQSRLPVTLVTGFLGSGKTTMINAALKAPEMARTVVVVNEFGEVGLDHSLVANSNDAVIVLENGCLCCTVRSDLVTTLNELYQSRLAGRIAAFDNVVIETSGLAEPGPVLQAFLSEPTLDGLYRVASVVTLVDAVNWTGTSHHHEEAVRQVALADQIRVTKLDMPEAGEAADTFADLRRLNPAAEIAPMDWTTASIAALLTSPGFDAADPKANRCRGCRCRATRRARSCRAMSATTPAATTISTTTITTISAPRRSSPSCCFATAPSRAPSCNSCSTASPKISAPACSGSRASSTSPRNLGARPSSRAPSICCTP